MGIVEQFVSLLHGPHELFHEFVVDSLYMLAVHVPKVPEECRRPELQLEKILKERIEQLETEDKEAYEVGSSFLPTPVSCCYSTMATDCTI